MNDKKSQRIHFIFLATVYIHMQHYVYLLVLFIYYSYYMYVSLDLGGKLGDCVALLSHNEIKACLVVLVRVNCMEGVRWKEVTPT